MKKETKPVVAEKTFPEVGTPLYLHTPCSYNWCLDEVKDPYTVIGVDKDRIIIQEANLYFNGPRYYNTIADRITPNPNGETLTLKWSKKLGKWCYYHYSGDKNPKQAEFGEYKHFPYMD